MLPFIKKEENTISDIAAMVDNLPPQIFCDPILQLVRACPLNFEIRETPHSVFLTIRKSFNNQSVRIQPNQTFSFKQENSSKFAVPAAQLESLKADNDTIKARNAFLEEANDTLAINLEQEATGAEHLNNDLQNTHENLKNLQTNFGRIESELRFRSVKSDKKQI